MTTTVPEQRRRLPRWAKGLLWVLAAVAVVVGGFVLWVLAALSGGFDDLLDVSSPTAGSREVVEARRRAEPAVQRDLEALVASTPLRRVDVEASAHDCEEGQHNWKVDDAYDLRCSSRRAVLLVGTPAQLSAGLEPLLSRVAAQGYAPLDPVAALDLSHLASEARTTSGTYDREARQLSLLVSRDPAYLPTYPPLAFERAGADVTQEQALAGLAPGDLVLMVVLEETYFEE